MARIGIDARMIENSGIGTYLRNFLANVKGNTVHEIVLFGDRDKLGKYGFEIVEAVFPIYGIKEQLCLPGLIRKAKVDLFHSPHYNVPVFSGAKLVTTVHDLIHIIFPEYLPNRIAYWYASLLMWIVARKSEKIIADSNSTKNDLLKYCGTDPGKVSVISVPISDQYMKYKGDGSVMKQRYGKYILYVGLIRPHKNVLGLLRSFLIVKKKYGIEHKLILIGKGQPAYIEAVNKFINENGLNDQVLRMHDIKSDDIIEYYAGADVFVFPTFYEGFGLPVLEAMACGCPVITSNVSSLPEVAGEAAVMVDPRNENELADKINSVISDGALRERLIASGRERVKLFRKSDFVSKTLAVYEDALKQEAL
jgi:glycosyltransferase involved in cell wall biosynthesis